MSTNVTVIHYARKGGKPTACGKRTFDVKFAYDVIAWTTCEACKAALAGAADVPRKRRANTKGARVSMPIKNGQEPGKGQRWVVLVYATDGSRAGSHTYWSREDAMAGRVAVAAELGIPLDDATRGTTGKAKDEVAARDAERARNRARKRTKGAGSYLEREGAEDAFHRCTFPGCGFLALSSQRGEHVAEHLRTGAEDGSLLAWAFTPAVAEPREAVKTTPLDADPELVESARRPRKRVHADGDGPGLDEHVVASWSSRGAA